MEDYSWLNITIEFAKITLAGLILFGVAYMVLRHLDRLKNRELSFKKRMEKEREMLPLKLKAQERLVIFLERITPAPLLMRVNVGGMTAAKLHFELLKAVREEFEHNMSMQLYVSPETWAATVAGRDEVVVLLHKCMQSAPADNTSIGLSQTILETEIRSGTPAIKKALKMLREETESTVRL